MTVATFTCSLLLLAADPSWFRAQAGAIKGLLDKGAARAGEALELADEMERKAVEQKDDDWKTYARWQRAKCERQLGHCSRAEEALKKAIDDVPPEDPIEHGLLFHLHCELGEVYKEANRYAKAQVHLDKALNWPIDRAEKERREKAEAQGHREKGLDWPLPLKIKGKKVYVPPLELLRLRLLRAACVANLRGPDAAWDGIKDVEAKIPAAIRETPKDDKPLLQMAEYLRIECQLLLAEQERRRADTASSLPRLRQCLEDLEADDSLEAQGWRFKCRIALGMSYMKLTRFADAEEQSKQAAKLLIDRIRNDATAAEVEFLRASWQIEQIGIRCEKARRAPGPDERVKRSAALLADLEEAERSLTRALDYSRKASSGPSVSTGNALFMLAEVHEFRASAHELKGDAAASRRELEAAGKGYDEAMRMLGSLLPPDNDWLLEVRRMRARLSLRVGDADTARKESDEALKLLVGAYRKEHMNYGPFQQLLLEAEVRRGHYREAADHARAHRQWSADRLAGELPGLTAAEQLSFFLRTDDPGLHASLRLGAAQESLYETSFEWLLNGKAKIADVLARQPEPGTKEAQELKKLVQRQAYLVYDGAAADPVKELRETELNTRLAVATRKGRGATLPYTVERLRKHLDPAEVYIDVVCLPGEGSDGGTYYAWVVTKGDPVRVVKLGKADTINELVNAFQDHQRHFPKTLRKVGPVEAEKKLRNNCLKDLSLLVLNKDLVSAAAGKTRWIVSPDFLLWNVPWAALIWPDGGKYAVEKITFRYVISGRDVIESRERPPGAVATGAPWILADPDLDHVPADDSWRRRKADDPLLLPQLKYGRAEGREVAACLGRFFTKVEPRVGARSSGKRELLELPKAPRVVYLATHGFYNLPLKPGLEPNDPFLRCGVAFAGLHFLPPDTGKGEWTLPGLMTGAEVLAAPLRDTELVVLSACDTGLGVPQYGQSPADLRHAFHFAGAHAVVSALWAVDDGPTSELMSDFMNDLYRRPQPDKADALRAAQRRLIERLGPEEQPTHPFSHPYYWAAFTLSGF